VANLGRASVLVRRLELRNADEKIVAPSTWKSPRPGLAVRPRSRCTRCAGYDEQTVRSDPAAERVWACARSARRAPRRTPGRVDRAAPATATAHRVLGGFPGHDGARTSLVCSTTVDTEFLHDFRVAVRRTRSTLKLGRPALPAVLHTRWEPAFNGSVT